METVKPTTTMKASGNPEAIQYAFPMIGSVVTESKMFGQPTMMSFVQTGMTLRDYFAAQVVTRELGVITPDAIAERAYRIADAMIAERSKVPS